MLHVQHASSHTHGRHWHPHCRRVVKGRGVATQGRNLCARHSAQDSGSRLPGRVPFRSITLRRMMATGKQPFESHPEYMEIAHKQYTSRFMRAIQLVLVALVIHYLWWWVPLVALAWWLCGLGYGWYVAALVAVYLPFFFDRKHMRLGRPVHWFRRLPVWRLLQCYLSLRVIRMRRLDPTKKYVFATLPHGILVLSRTAFYGGDFEQLFPGVDFRCLGATPMFLTPAARELCMALGAVDASRASAERVLKAGKSLQVYPGGWVHCRPAPLALRRRFSHHTACCSSALLATGRRRSSPRTQRQRTRLWC